MSPWITCPHKLIRTVELGLLDVWLIGDFLRDVLLTYGLLMLK